MCMGPSLRSLILEQIWSPSFESKDNVRQGHDLWPVISHEITQEKQNTIDRSVCFNFSMPSFNFQSIKVEDKLPPSPCCNYNPCSIWISCVVCDAIYQPSRAASIYDICQQKILANITCIIHHGRVFYN